jgi:chemotaxis protein MotB
MSQIDPSLIQFEEEHDEGGDEIWLISYSDLMTLLFGFFVLMYSFAVARTPEKVERVKEGVARSFGGSYVAPFEKLLNKLNEEKVTDPILQDIAIEPLKNGLEVTFQSGILFELGSSELTDEVKESLQKMARIIAANIDEDEIMIQGHTDDAPINTVRFPSNWELSTARAASVVREFIRFGYQPEKIMAVGYAESRPLYPNRDELGVPIPENRARNRRVVIKIVAPGYVDSSNGKEKSVE